MDNTNPDSEPKIYTPFCNPLFYFGVLKRYKFFFSFHSMEEPKRRPSMMSKYVDSQVKIAFKNKYPISIICEFEKLDKEMCDRLYWKNQLISQEKEKGGALANAGLKEKKIFSYESPGGLPDIGDARTLGWIYPYGLAGGLFLKQWKMGLKNRPKLGGKKYYLDLRRYRGGTLASAGSL